MVPEWGVLSADRGWNRCQYYSEDESTWHEVAPYVIRYINPGMIHKTSPEL